jgi:hypothetical protein
MQKKYVLGFGDRHFTISLPTERVVNEIEGKLSAEITDIPSAVKEALQHPIGS